MIKIIAFDLGDVLIKDPLKALERKYWTNKTSPADAKKFRAAVEKVDTGKAGEDFLIKVLHETLTPHLSGKQIEKRLMTTRLLPPWQLLLKAKRQYPVAILTNNFRNGPSTYAKILKIDLSPYQIVNSALVGIRKPHPRYYRTALRRLKVKPEELIFIDDLAANVAAAKKLGIKAFRYNKNMPQLRAFLKRNGVSGL